MSKSQNIDFTCPTCRNSQKTLIFTSITASHNQHLKEQFLNDQLNKFTCKFCNSKYSLEVPVLYHDVKKKIAIWYSKDPRYVPKPQMFDNYLSRAEVVHTLDDLKKLSGDEEEEVSIVHFKGLRRLLLMEKYGTIDESLEDYKIINDVENQKQCPNCGSSDQMFGLSHSCENCGHKKIRINNENLFMALSLFQIFNYFINKNERLELHEKIKKALSDSIQGNTGRNIDHLFKYCNEIKICGNNKVFLHFTESNWELNYSSESLSDLYSICRRPEEIIYAAAALKGYINLHFSHQSPASY